jgi:transcriptional regulator with XRE-family HTH domain
MENMTLRRQVGQAIRLQREAQSLTLKMLADMVGTSYTHLWKIENAKISVGLDLLGRISSALDIPIYALFEPCDGRLVLEYTSEQQHSQQHSQIKHD